MDLPSRVQPAVQSLFVLFPAGSITTLNRASISLNTFNFDIRQNISVQLSQNKSAIKTVGRITRIAAILKNKTLQNKLNTLQSG